MRRVVCLVAAVVCAVVFAGCGSDPAEPEPIEPNNQGESSGGGDKEKTPEAPETPDDESAADTLEAMPKVELQAELDTFFADFFKAKDEAFLSGDTATARQFCEQTVKPCWAELDAAEQIYDNGGEIVRTGKGYGKPDVFITSVQGDHVKVDVKVSVGTGEIRNGDGSTSPLPADTFYYVFGVDRKAGELVMTSGTEEEQ